MNLHKKCILLTAILLITVLTLSSRLPMKASNMQTRAVKLSSFQTLEPPKINNLGIPGKIAFIHEASIYLRLYVAYADGTNVNQIASANVDGNSEQTISNVALSPDGTKLAYYTGQIILVDLDGTKVKNRHVLIPPENFLGSPDTFIDASTLRITSGSDHWLVDWNTKTSKRADLNAHPCKCPLTYSPDRMKGFTIVENEIRFFSPEGKLVETLNAKSALYQVTWSPDGKLVAYATKEGIFVYDVVKKAVQEVPTERRAMEPYVWTSDSRYLAYVAYTTKPEGGEHREIFVVDISTGNRQKLVSGPSYNVAWSN
jgi:Tol biopolymer transport system component